MNKLILISLIFLYVTNFSYGLKEADEQNIWRIELIRQKSPRSQIRKYSSILKKYGYNIDNAIDSPPRTNDSIALYRALNNNEFYGKIIIGHPAQQFNVAFDTAWSLTWIMSSRCNDTYIKGCKNHNLYDHTRSSEWKKDGRPFLLNMGTYNLTGFYSYDNFTFAHSNVTTQSFVEITNVPDDFAVNKADGLMGLGLKSDSYDPFFYKLLNQKKIKDPIFSIFLNRDATSNRGGNIILGFIDSKHIHKSVIDNKVVPDNITYLPVTSKQYWQFKVDQIYLDPWRKNKESYTFCDGGCQAITDTNSNEIIGPDEMIDTIHDSILAFYNNNTDQYLVNCDTVSTLPHMNFQFAGKNFTLIPKSYIIKVTVNYISQCVTTFRKGAPKGNWILGGSFLADYYSIYNVHDRTIGFVRSASSH